MSRSPCPSQSVCTSSLRTFRSPNTTIASRPRAEQICRSCLARSASLPSCGNRCADTKATPTPSTSQRPMTAGVSRGSFTCARPRPARPYSCTKQPSAWLPAEPTRARPSGTTRDAAAPGLSCNAKISGRNRAISAFTANILSATLQDAGAVCERSSPAMFQVSMRKTLISCAPLTEADADAPSARPSDASWLRLLPVPGTAPIAVKNAKHDSRVFNCSSTARLPLASASARRVLNASMRTASASTTKSADAVSKAATPAIRPRRANTTPRTASVESEAAAAAAG